MLNKTKLSVIIFLTLINTSYAQNIFVSTAGNDSNTGTIDQPLGTITAAINKIQPGDTIFVRGDTYDLASTINIAISGTIDSMYYLFSYNSEKVVLDFSAVSVGTKGIKLNADYWFIKGINVTKAGHNGLGITGSNNIIEFCSFFENRNTGLQLDNGASNNRVINCDSYYNYDEHNQGRDADGFAPKLTVGSGNYFYGCRSWNNSDDGWDGYMRGATDVTTTLENCWTFNNGYTKTGYDPGSQANGNGFKMGGGDNSNSQHLMHHFILKNCLSFDNKVKGFDQNNNDGSMTLLNCTGFGNKGNNYKITRQVNDSQTVKVENCVSFEGGVDLGSFVIQQTNSWSSPFTVTDDDFFSIDTTGMRAPRKPDGRLPDITFMHLASGSDLIDAGIDIGLPYNGNAPDLGAFESEITTAVNDNDGIIPTTFSLLQNYPNPFNPTTIITYELPIESRVNLSVYNILGQEIAVLKNTTQDAGNHKVEWKAAGFSSGVYIYKLSAVSTDYKSRFTKVIKMILMK